MKRCLGLSRGFTLVEVMVTTALFGIFGVIIYSLLNIGTILGAKNSAVNIAHQQARTAMLQMLQDLHSCVSVPELTDASGVVVGGSGPAAGISFQLLSQGPLQIFTDANAGQKIVKVKTTKAISAGQRLIVRTHGIEDDIVAASAPAGGVVTLTMTNNLAAKIDVTSGTPDYNVVCYITDHCSYTVVPTVPQPATGFTGSLQWIGPTTKKTFAVLGNDITEPNPFSKPLTPAGSLYHRFVAAINLSTADPNYSNRAFKSANILLNGLVPMRAKLTDQQ